MPNDAPTPPRDPAVQTPPPDTPAATPTTPTVDLSNYVSREQYDRLEQQLAAQGRMLESIAGGMQVRATPTAPAGPQYTDEQLAEMLESGEGRKILEAQTYITQRSLAPLAREFVDFRDRTTHTAAQFNREIAEARGKLPHASDPGVRRSMDEFLAKLDPAVQASPQTLELAHAWAIAQPENMKRIVDGQVEAELRRRAGQDEPTGTPERPAQRLPERAGDVVPTVGELLGPEAAQAIRAQGYTNVNDWVRKSQRGRYKDWPEMAKAIMKDRETEGSLPDTEDRYLQ